MAKGHDSGPSRSAYQGPVCWIFLAGKREGRAMPKHPGTANRKRLVIGWAALGAFALGASGVVIAVQRGQDVCEVSATGVKFCDREEERQEVVAAQPAIADQVSALQSQAQALGTDEGAPGLIDISGTWISDDGFTYVIEQFGNQAVLTELGFGGMATGFASGTVDGTSYTFDFQAADGSFGTGSLDLADDTLSGSFDNAVTGLSTAATLRR
jgi:hypothetical protein